MQILDRDGKWFRVSLRLYGDGLRPDTIAAKLDIEPSSIGKAGEHIGGNPRYARHRTNLWIWSFTDDSTIIFERQIEELLEFLEPRRNELEAILASPEVEGELFLGFSSGNGQGGALLSSSLLARIAALGLALSLDLYPPSETGS